MILHPLQYAQGEGVYVTTHRALVSKKPAAGRKAASIGRLPTRAPAASIVCFPLGNDQFQTRRLS
jgi:hypothetical protein